MFETGPVEVEFEAEVEILTQRSRSSSQDSHGSCLDNAKRPFKKRQPSMPEEVNTQDLPGFIFMLPRREEVDNDNENKNQEVAEEAAEEDDKLEVGNPSR
jgi:hypothetical protein